MPEGIRRGLSMAADADAAVREFHDQVAQPDPALVLFFCAPTYDLDRLARAMDRAFPGVTVVGCTTAGEITPMGYRTGSLTGLSLARSVCHAEVARFEPLGAFSFGQGLDAVRGLSAAMAARVGSDFAARSFAMLMIDGLSAAEDAVLAALHTGLPDIPLFGGSAGDGLSFRRTFVFQDGRFQSDAAVLALIHTPCPFRVFKTQHFVGSDRKMVITGADPSRRVVTEINAEPAGAEFARMVGLETAELSPMIFATSPVMVRVGGADYVRSIQKVNPDGSLQFFCAIDEGLVLSVARRVDPFENLRQALLEIERDIGSARLIIGCECVLRLLEMDRLGLKTRMWNLIATRHVVGFNTYGEQFNGMHVNQTFTGVALGGPPP